MIGTWDSIFFSIVFLHDLLGSTCIPIQHVNKENGTEKLTDYLSHNANLDDMVKVFQMFIFLHACNVGYDLRAIEK